MIRDTFFSQTRFVNLCRKEMVENWKSNLLRVALMYGAYVADVLVGHHWEERSLGLMNFICPSTGEHQGQEVGVGG